MEEGGDKGCTEEENGIHGAARQDIEPENGVVVVVRGLLHVGQCLRETCTLDAAGYQCKDGDDSHDAVVAL